MVVSLRLLHYSDLENAYDEPGRAARVAGLAGYTTAYTFVGIENTLKKGANTIAIHCRQTKGGQYIDAGLVELVYEERPE